MLVRPSTFGLVTYPRIRKMDYFRLFYVNGRGVRKGCCLSPILFNLYGEYLTKEALEVLGDFKIGGQIIHTVKYADDLVLLAKEEKVLQDVIDKLIEIGRYYGMEMNEEKTNVMKNTRQPLPVKIEKKKKKLENVESSNQTF
jgi:hypothetical protein